MSKGRDRTVYPRDDGRWANKRNDADRASSLHTTQRDAEKAAREMLGNQGGGELTIMGRDGKIGSKDTIAPGALMSKGSIHVVSRSDGGWSVRKTGDSRACGKFASQSEAISCARSVAISSRGEIIIHGRDGRVRARDSYGVDRCPPHGER